MNFFWEHSMNPDYDGPMSSTISGDTVADITDRIARTLNLELGRVRAAALLLDEGATIPFIARYRKEATGSMDEVVLLKLRDELQNLRELEKRRGAILSSLAERNLLTAEVESSIRRADSRTALEDAYLPWRPKRKTRALAAREAGYGPLAKQIYRNQDDRADLAGFENPDAALAGARDILAEDFNEETSLRSSLRLMTAEEGVLSAKVIGKKKNDDDAAVYRDYFDFEEPLRSIPSHRILAVLRGNREGYLRVKARVRDIRATEWLERRLIRGRGPNAEVVKQAIADSWNRLMAPSLETDVLKELKTRADTEAIRVFTRNLETMLLSPPLGRRPVVAVDPGYRTGGKVCALDAQGSLHGHDVIHPEGSEAARSAAVRILKQLSEKVQADTFAVGNGTAGRETEEFIRDAFPGSTVISVDERGASVYSASDEARREFGEYDLTVRGSVSIGRRLQDPLAELVKIDPAAIGVGQYQHDVDPAALAQALDDTVRSAVNAVGVELNSASAALLSRVSGLGPKLAEAIVNRRNTEGPYRNRRELLKVPRLGAKAFEQAAGFLRITGGEEALDASAVHPERYSLVKAMAENLGTDVSGLLASPDLRKKIRAEDYAGLPDSKGTPDGPAAAPAGLPTIRDILAELEKPGRDPRGRVEEFRFNESIRSINDVEDGMILPGRVTNVTAFGAFIDVGAHRDGLVHISHLADRYVKDPSDVVSVGDTVRVRVLEVDRKRERMSFSMKDLD